MIINLDDMIICENVIAFLQFRHTLKKKYTRMNEILLDSSKQFRSIVLAKYLFKSRCIISVKQINIS